MKSTAPFALVVAAAIAAFATLAASGAGLEAAAAAANHNTEPAGLRVAAP